MKEWTWENFIAIITSTRLLIAMGVFVGMGVAVAIAYRLLVYFFSRDCPYCHSPALRKTSRLSVERREMLYDAADRVGLEFEPGEWWVCVDCGRVVDHAMKLPAHSSGASSMERGAIIQDSLIILPVLSCRKCTDGELLSGGKLENQTCPECKTEYDWWIDEESGFKFFIAKPKA